MSGHTPTPWLCTRSGPNMRTRYNQSFAIAELGERNLIAGCFADVSGGETVAKANAELIVRAVNNHDRLVEALSNIAGGRGIAGLADAFVQGNASSAIDCIQQYARQALAAARGEA